MSALDQIDRMLGAVGEVLDWGLAALRPVLPGALASAGYRSRRRVVGLDLDHGATERGLLVSSFFGETTLRPSDGLSKPRGVTGVLHPDAQFTITTELSEAAARAGRAAIALRLEQLSPIPVDDALFAYRRLSPAGIHPVRVEVSIARRVKIDAAAQRLAGMDDDWRLVGQMSDDGKSDLEFKSSARQPMGLGLKLLIVSAAIAAALLAWSGRLEQAALDLQLTQGRLALAAREASAANRQLEDVAAAHRASLANPQVQDWIQALSGFGPEAQPYTAIRITGDEVVLENDGHRVASAPALPIDTRIAHPESGEAAP